AIRGEAHDQEFEVECLIPDLDIRTVGAGHSRRSAEQNAATAAYQAAINE
ncbi:MAG: ribonuclease III, partial [Nitrosomonadales bacterium]